MLSSHILEIINQSGIRIFLKKDGNLKVDAPKGRLTPEILDILKKNKPQIISYLKEQNPGLDKIADLHETELTPDQYRMWFLNEVGMQSAYNSILVFKIEGHLDIDFLKKSVELLYKNQLSLRLKLTRPNHDCVRQYISTDQPNSLKIEEKKVCQVDQFIREIASHKFDFDNDTFAFFWIIQVNESINYFAFCINHIISDGWSKALICREIAAYYNSFRQGEEPLFLKSQIDYLDYAHWLNKRMPFKKKALLSFWKKKLSGAPLKIDFPKDRPYPVVPQLTGGVKTFTLSKTEQNGLIQISEKCQSTLFQSALAIFSVLVQRFSQQDDFLIGTAVANRPDKRLENLIGFFVNTVIIRFQFNPHMTFRELSAYLKEYLIEVFEFTECPFESLVQELNPPRSLGHAPLVQILFVESYADSESINLNGLQVTQVPCEQIQIEYDLRVYINFTDDVKIKVEYNSYLFEEASIDRMLVSFRQLIPSISENVEGRFSSFQIISDEQRELLASWNQTETAHEPTTIDEKIDLIAREKPDAVALYHQGNQMTYGQLQHKSDQLANFLVNLNLPHETPIGIYSERNMDLIVALLAILKTGCPYVPLDPEYPQQRIDYIIEHSGLRYIVHGKSLKRDFSSTDFTLVPISSTAPERKYEVKRSASDLAYILYTSGSTGKPKGVAVEHRSVSALFEWHSKTFSDSQVSCVLGSTSICFDISVFEIWLTLGRGGSLVVCQSLLEIARIPEKNRLTLIQTVPSAGRLLVDEDLIPSSVKTIVLGGEFVPQNLIDDIYESSSVDCILDAYGPTEDTVWSTFKKRKPKGKASIGRPIHNSKAYILDAQLNLLPPGIPGELYLAGQGLARGYYKNDEITAERFLCSPFLTHERLYKTGDLVRWNSQGDLEYLGRLDNQIKLRGFRIELDEINTLIQDHEAIKSSVVSFDESNQLIVAYLHWNFEEELDKLRAKLNFSLPDYMVPTHFISLTEMPLTANGKIDRKALPPANFDSFRDSYEAPKNSLEIMIAEYWRKILNLEKVGRTDDFFSIGGHSLQALKFINFLNSKLERKITLILLFQNPVLYKFAEKIQQMDAEKQSLVHFQPAKKSLRSPIIWISVGPDRLKIIESFNDESDIIVVSNYFVHEIQKKHAEYTISDFSHESINDIKAYLNQQTVILGGFSAGALLAFETAHQLKASGINISYVFLLDPTSTKADTEEQVRGEMIQRAAQNKVYWLWRNFRELITFKKSKWLFIPKWINHKKNQYLNKNSLSAQKMYLKAAQKYMPKKIDAKVVLFFKSSDYERRTQIWKKIQPNASFVELPTAKHLQIVRGKSTEIWLQEIKNSLGKRSE